MKLGGDILNVLVDQIRNELHAEFDARSEIERIAALPAEKRRRAMSDNFGPLFRFVIAVSYLLDAVKELGSTDHHVPKFSDLGWQKCLVSASLASAHAVLPMGVDCRAETIMLAAFGTGGAMDDDFHKILRMFGPNDVDEGARLFRSVSERLATWRNNTSRLPNKRTLILIELWAKPSVFPPLALMSNSSASKTWTFYCNLQLGESNIAPTKENFSSKIKRPLSLSSYPKALYSAELEINAGNSTNQRLLITDVGSKMPLGLGRP